jgi:L-ascorbate metabolism protein UlaG (beta-lactamase superfamily)
MLKERSPTKWPRLNSISSPIRKILPTPSGESAITFIGQSTFLLQLGEINILTDPIFSRRASPVQWIGPKRARLPGIALADLPEIHLILVSHNHYDHLDLFSLRKLSQRFAPQVLTPLGNRALILESGLSKITELDWWQSHEIGKVRITATPAQHFSARSFFDRNKALWSGFVVEDPARTIFFSGDTGYGEHFKEIAHRFPKMDLALLPIGSYEPRWFMRELHTNPEEAVQAFLDSNAKQAIGMHFGTFQLTDEGIDEPTQDLQRALNLNGLGPQQFRVLEFGETAIF